MRWHHIFDRPTFDRARRREAYRRFSRAVRKEDRQGLLPLDQVTARLGIFEQTYVGIQPIPVASIVGSADQNRDFDRDWLPTREDVKERWEQLERAFPAGDFPPIVVYDVDASYFVVDGHHRVAIARHKKVEMIDAEITRLHSRVELPAGADIATLILAEQERLFLERSGLNEAAPDLRIKVSRAQGYLELLELVEVHGYHLSVERDELVRPVETARDWYASVYRPTVNVIREEGLGELFGGAPEGDLFLSVYERRMTLFPERKEVTLEDAARVVGEEERGRKPGRRFGR